MDGASAIQMVCPSQSNADATPTPTGFAEIVGDGFPRTSRGPEVGAYIKSKVHGAMFSDGSGGQL